MIHITMLLLSILCRLMLPGVLSSDRNEYPRVFSTTFKRLLVQRYVVNISKILSGLPCSQPSPKRLPPSSARQDLSSTPDVPTFFGRFSSLFRRIHSGAHHTLTQYRPPVVSVPYTRGKRVSPASFSLCPGLLF